MTIFCVAAFTAEATETLLIERDFKQPTISMTDGETTVAIEGLELTQIDGTPQLPYRLIRVVIPAGKKIDTIITRTKSDTTELSHPLSLFKSMVRTTSTSLISSQAMASQSPVELLSIQKKAGIPIAHIALNPLSVEGRNLIYRETIIAEITFRNDQTSSSQASGSIDAPGLAVVNPSALRGYSIAPPIRSDAEYLLITTKEMKEAVTDYTIADLLRLREAQGLTHKTLTIAEIQSGFDGEDLPAKIRNAIKRYVAERGTKYVFIAGDHTVVPARFLTVHWGSTGPERFQVASDLYYQCHDGSFNEDGDSLYGEMSTDGPAWNQMDFMPEVAIGRTPVENPIELSNYIAKTLRYETAPATTEALKRVLFAGEYLGFSGDMQFGKVSLEEIRLGAAVGNLTAEGFTAIEGIETATLYDADRPANNRWGKEDIGDSINSNRFSLLSHVGHGLTSEGFHLKNGDVAKLSNSFPLFVYSEACVIGRFEKHSILEELLNSHRSGLWGAVANSGYGSLAPPSTNGPTHLLHRTFWHGACRKDNPIRRVGDLAVYMHDYNATLKMNNLAYVHYETTLFADPATVLRLPGSAAISETVIIKPNNSSIALQGRELIVEWLNAGNSSVTFSLLASNGTTIDLSGTYTAGNAAKVSIPQTVSAGTYQIKLSGDHSSALSEPFLLNQSEDYVITSPAEEDVLISETETSIEWKSSGKVALFLVKEGKPVKQLFSSLDGNSCKWAPASSLPRGYYTIGLIPLSSPGSMIQSKPFYITHAMINTYTWSENFDSFPLGTTVAKKWQQSDRDALQWQVHTGPTPRRAAFASSPRTGAPGDHTSGNGNYMFIEADMFSTMLKTGDLMLPLLDLSGVKEPKISFWYHMFSSTNMMGALSLYVLDGGFLDTLLVSRVRDQGDSWQKIEVDLTPWQGDTVQLILRAMTGEMEDSDICIDDFQVLGSGSVAITPDTGYGTTDKLYAIPSISSGEEPIRFYLPAKSEILVSGAIFDKLGNLMDYYEGSIDRDGLILTWDLKNSYGQVVAPGSYLFIGQTEEKNGHTKQFSISVGVQK